MDTILFLGSFFLLQEIFGFNGDSKSAITVLGLATITIIITVFVGI